MKEIQRRYLHLAWWQPRNVAWWLWLALTVGGFALFMWLMWPSMTLMPGAAVTGLVMSAVLVVFWTWFIRRPQIFSRISSRAAWACVAWGAGAAVGSFAIIGNESIIAIVGQTTSVATAQTWGAGIAAPITEEIGKTLGVVVVLLVARSRIRTPMEGLFLGALVGLGFEVSENFLYGFNLSAINLGEEPVVATLFAYALRSVVFASISHMLLSALAGAGLAYLWTRQSPRRPWWGIALLTLAFGFHGLWNSPLLEPVWWRFLVAAVIPVTFYAAVKLARRHEQAWFRAVLAPEVARGTVAHAYVDAVAPSLRLRRKYRNEVGAAYGPRAVEYQKYLDGLLVDLADAVSVGDEASAAQYRAAVQTVVGTATPSTS